MSLGAATNASFTVIHNTSLLSGQERDKLVSFSNFYCHAMHCRDPTAGAMSDAKIVFQGEEGLSLFDEIVGRNGAAANLQKVHQNHVLPGSIP